ncbi:hypothetical protein BC832DRAFT_221947 [Gaertneriomyces semiglobifer]|nr:hypothetical protein BC832DRAFT_221947 [Gaertneriomyces semiglobifer]
MQATTKVGLGLFTELHNGAPEVLGTAGVNDSERAYVYSCGDQLFQFNETYTYMYPNTGGQIRVLRRELKGRDGNIEWLGRIIDQDAVFSWGRKAMDISESRLTGTYDDGTVIVATFKGAAGVTLELSTATGLHITWGNEGIISQRYVTYINERVSSSHSAARPRHEVLRETLRDATTIVYLSDGSVEVLYPNGNTAIRDFSGRWSSTNATGVKHSASPTNDGIASSSVQVVQLKDDVAHKTVISRADLVTVSFEANQCITEHSDGTTFIQHGLNNIDRRDVRTEIKHKEFASVHLCGDRSSITVDSANVTVEFENDGPSGVISRIIKGQHMIELSGSGVATIRCLPIGDAQSDRSSATLGRGGSYRVNYCTGELEARDWKGNKFSIGENGITE